MKPVGFHWSDFLTFAAMLLVSAVIGLAFSRRNLAKSAGGIFVGNRKMTLLPVTLSAFATFMSAVGILGVPLEIYHNGLAFCFLDPVAVVGTTLTCFVFVPFFYQLGCVSVYEYVRLRFNATVSSMAAAMTQLGLFLYMSVVLYAPSVAFSQISGLSLWITIPCVGIVCTLYTAFGGLQGVMWTDVWQSAFMFTGLISVIVVGTINVGGADKVIEAAQQGGRFSLAIDTTFDPFIRHSVLSVVIGGGFYLSASISNQPLFQRYISCKTLRIAQKASWLCLLVNVTFQVLMYATGLVAFAYFTCDPLVSGEIKKPQQLIPYTVMKTMALPGIAGLFLACTFSGALSTISSCINSISMVIIVDFIGPFRRFAGKTELSDGKLANLSKMIATVLGSLMIAMAFLCDKLSALIVQITMSIGGMTIGPCYGVILAGMFLPFVNSAGATSGFVISALFAIFVGVGSAVSGITSYSPKLPLSTHGCPALNATLAYNTTSTSTNRWYTDVSSSTSQALTAQSTLASSDAAGWRITEIFRLSYMLYCLTSAIIFLLVSISVSLCTKCNNKRAVDPRLIYWTRRPPQQEKSNGSADEQDYEEQDDYSNSVNLEAKL